MCFNSRTRVGCDEIQQEATSQAADVSIHAPAWGAMADIGDFAPHGAVSIHAPAWGAIILPLVVLQVFSVSIHAPAWGAIILSFSISATASSFNSRTRVGCDSSQRLLHPRIHGFNSRTRVGCDCLKLFLMALSHKVSIHAPAWGAILAILIRPRADGFNSRTRVGCDLAGRTHFSYPRSFNSRTRVGCDGQSRSWCFRIVRVSIHAPAWGAMISGFKLLMQESFQFTHPRGVRSLLVLGLERSLCFNSRTRVGCDSARSTAVSRASGFNSRTRVGCDLHVFDIIDDDSIVSIHAPAWGAISQDISNAGKQCRFQFTHPRGVRSGSGAIADAVYEFQFTHPRGVRYQNHARQ